jgi:hypothetical protein
MKIMKFAMKNRSEAGHGSTASRTKFLPAGDAAERWARILDYLNCILCPAILPVTPALDPIVKLATPES